ncbi:MAG: ferredoxin [Gemmatimonadetes bacterium]|nr:ferredoxin [Gemmatimonadota bacterium]
MSVDERKIGELTVQIDRDSCISSGNCIKVTPELFEFDDESIAVFAKTAADCTREQVIEACEVCPVDALIVKDSSGKQIVP